MVKHFYFRNFDALFAHRTLNGIQQSRRELYYVLMKGIQPSWHLNGSFTHSNGWFGWMRSILLYQRSHRVCIDVKPLNDWELIDNHEIVVFDAIVLQITDFELLQSISKMIKLFDSTRNGSNRINWIAFQAIFVFTLFIIFCIIIINSRALWCDAYDINRHRLLFNRTRCHWHH